MTDSHGIDEPAERLSDGVRPLMIDLALPVYDVAVTEHIVIDAPVGDVFTTAGELDFLTVRTPLLVASMFVRGLPARLSGSTTPVPPQLRLINDSGKIEMPGWLLIGVVDGNEIAFGAVGKFWKPDIEWRDVTADEFAVFREPGWGKITCHFRVRPDGPGRSILTYECRVATTDRGAQGRMSRYWWLIRPFVVHIMRATLRTIARSSAG